MGNCFGVEDQQGSQLTPEERRERQHQAALRRQQEAEKRGLKDSGAVQRLKQAQKRDETAYSRNDTSGPGLQWKVG
eukprot:m.108323 g.108323  ORF g.108323 m.108323 type:complete len:76 (-) comp13958_c0_seq3:4094-4321(-)